MPTNTGDIRHLFAGGWATDYGPTVDVVPDQSGQVKIPFLVDAEDVAYELDGGPHKIGGTTRLNGTVIQSGAAVRGLFDYWRQGVAGSPTRRRIVAASDKILGDTDDHLYATTVASGWSSTAVPSFLTFDDLLIVSNDSTSDVPRSWDQTTAQALAGSPPRFSFAAKHKNRVWAAGNYAFPSRLYYCVSINPEDWTGSGSGSIDIDPDDGDMITGVASHKNDLWVFKGPYRGSIHRITGSTTSDFARTTFIEGLGAGWHNSIFRFADDLGFVSPHGTIHSLAATASYGDFNETALSRPIQSWLQSHLNLDRLRHIWAVNDITNGAVMFTISVDSSSTNNAVLMMDYRFQPVRWSYIPSYDVGSLAIFNDTSSFKRVFAGSNDGYVLRTRVADRSLADSGALSAKVTTPFLNYGQPVVMKTLSAVSIGLAPRGAYNVIFGWTRDGNAQQTTTISQGGGDVLGSAAANEFTLGSSALAGSAFVDRFAELEEGGEFRSIQYQLVQSGVSEDMEVHAISAAIKPGARSTSNALGE